MFIMEANVRINVYFCAHKFFQNSRPFMENSVDPDQVSTLFLSIPLVHIDNEILNHNID